MDSLTKLCVVGVPDILQRAVLCQICKQDPPTEPEARAIDLPEWWPLDLKNLFRLDPDAEFYLHNLTILSRHSQERDGLLAIEQASQGVVLRWKWEGVDRVRNDVEPDDVAFDVFVQRYVCEYYRQEAENARRYSEKCVEGRYVRSPSPVRDLDPLYPND